jgi:hypothetical protein
MAARTANDRFMNETCSTDVEPSRLRAARNENERSSKNAMPRYSSSVLVVQLSCATGAKVWIGLRSGRCVKFAPSTRA